jgi:hypothetical protein
VAGPGLGRVARSGRRKESQEPGDEPGSFLRERRARWMTKNVNSS